MENLEGKHILIIVENLSVPFDRRVWNEATTLQKHGAKISVICPKMKGFNKKYEVIEGIEIFRHPLLVEARGKIAYFLEYSSALFWEFVLSLRIYLKSRFHVIHACNPPDLIFLIALPFKCFGVKFVFDHHDINPELYLAKYNKRGLFYKFLLWVERATFRFADFSIATNESYKKIAVDRGKMDPNKVAVVRSGPDLKKFVKTPGNLIYKKGKKYLIGYLGVIGEQEGIDLLLYAIQNIIKDRNDIQFAIIGGGPSLEIHKRKAHQLHLSEFVDFYGRVSDEMMIEIINTADICVNPDKYSAMNDLSTMNKIMEYMALGKPIVQFDLKEGRVSALESSLYAKNNDPIDFARCILHLIENENLIKSMGEYGYQRVFQELSWAKEQEKLIRFYNYIFECFSHKK